MSFDIWVSLAVLFFMGGLMPGPAVGLVMASSYQYGFRPAMLAAAGIASTNVVWLVLAASGATTILTRYPQTLIFMKLIGAVFILYFGLRAIFGPLPDIEPDIKSSKIAETKLTQTANYRRLYRHGVMLQLSSPMPLVFFGGLLPAYFDASLPLSTQVFIMLLTITTTELLGLAAYGAGAQRIKSVLTAPRAARRFNVLIGLFMIISGFWAIFSTH